MAAAGAAVESPHLDPQAGGTESFKTCPNDILPPARPHLLPSKSRPLGAKDSNAEIYEGCFIQIPHSLSFSELLGFHFHQNF